MYIYPKSSLKSRCNLIFFDFNAQILIFLLIYRVNKQQEILQHSTTVIV